MQRKSKQRLKRNDTNPTLRYMASRRRDEDERCTKKSRKAMDFKNIEKKGLQISRDTQSIYH